MMKTSFVKIIYGTMIQMVRMGVFDEPNFERIDWVNITGVPISIRLEENYTTIANIFGETLQANIYNYSVHF